MAVAIVTLLLVAWLVHRGRHRWRASKAAAHPLWRRVIALTISLVLMAAIGVIASSIVAFGFVATGFLAG